MALPRDVSIDPVRVEVAPPQYIDSCPWNRCPFGRWALAATWVEVRGRVTGRCGLRERLSFRRSTGFEKPGWA